MELHQEMREDMHAGLVVCCGRQIAGRLCGAIDGVGAGDFISSVHVVVVVGFPRE